MVTKAEATTLFRTTLDSLLQNILSNQGKQEICVMNEGQCNQVRPVDRIIGILSHPAAAFVTKPYL